MAAFFIFLSCASIVAGAPSVSFPINSQVPPVARVSGIFEFAFSPWTFTSDVQPISYTLVSGPSWLMFDGITRNLYGTPALEDVGVFTIKITATDSTGSADTEATFVVSSEIGPVVGRGIGSQLKDIGEADGKGGLVFLPGQAYDFSFADDTFAPPGVVKRYDAVSTGNTPLPSWINFDGGRLKFTGTTPKLASLIAPPQTWDVTLIASDYPGFAGASVSFQIVVGPHRILFEDTSFTTNATAGSQFSYKIPRGSILLDSEPIASENLSSISTTASDWLSFDPTTYILSGTPPEGAGSTKVSIVARDVFGGSAQAELEISVLSSPTSIFTTEIPDFNVTGGEKFVYSFNRSSLSSKDVKLSVKYKPVTVDWITFDAGNLQFRGKAPNDSLSIEVLVSAQSPGKLSDSRSFNIYVVSSTSTVTSTKLTPITGTAVPTRTSFPKDTSNQLDMSAGAISKRRRKRTLIIVLATVLPLCVVCSFLFIWYFISHQKDGDSSSYYSRSTTPMGSEISRPLEALPAPWQLNSKIKDSDLPRRLSTFGYFTTDGSGRISNGFMSSMMSSGGTILRLGTPPTPPTPPTQLLPPAPENVESSSTAINFSKNPAIPRASYPSGPSGPSYSLHPALAKSNSRGPAGHPAHQRASSRGVNGHPPRRLSDQSHRRHSSMSTKGAVSRRMSSGVGHGRPTFGGPPGYGVPKRSWRRTNITPGFWVGGRGLRESDATFETVSTEIFNQIAQIGQTNNVDQPSVRLVGDSPEGSAGKAAQARARGSSPFFAGSATAWRRGSKMHAPPPVFKPSKRQENDQDSLMDDVIRAMSRENSHTKTIGTYSSLNLPETPMRRYNSALPSHFATSSSFGNYRTAGAADGGEDEFKHVVDENGQRIWYPNRSRGSEVTAYSRGGSSYYPYEPFEYGVAVTSTRAQGPATGRPSYEEERRPYVRSKGAEPIPPPRQRAKLVDFTKKRPVSISEEGGEDDQNKSSFPVDMAYL